MNLMGHSIHVRL